MARKPTSVLKCLASPTAGTIVGLISLVIPVAGFVSSHDQVKNAFLVMSALIIVALMLREHVIRGSRVTARRGDPFVMADPVFYKAVQQEVVQKRVSDLEDLADGILRIFGPEVRYVSVLLFRTLAESTELAKEVYAMDLTRDPDILSPDVST